MTTQPTTKVTFQSLATLCNATEQEVRSLLKTHNLTPENLTQVQIESIKSELNKAIQIKPTLQAPTVKAPMSLNGQNTGKSTLPVIPSVLDFDSMTLEEIEQYEKDQDELLEKQKKIASIKAKRQALIELQDSNLSITLENESADASYKMRLESQPQLLALSIDNAKSLQAEIVDREINALSGMTKAKRETPTSFEMLELGAKKSQRSGQNRFNMILNSTEELVPTMRLTGSKVETEAVTIDM